MVFDWAAPRPAPDLPSPLESNGNLTNPHLHAASRKIAIAWYHYRELVRVVWTHQPLPVEAPVDVQACFEAGMAADLAVVGTAP